MDRNTFFGGHPLAVIVRLAVISIAVGIVLKALGIDLSNFFYRINVLLRNIYDLGFEAINWVLEYLLLGALVVVPVWLIARMLGAAPPGAPTIPAPELRGTRRRLTRPAGRPTPRPWCRSIVPAMRHPGCDRRRRARP